MRQPLCPALPNAAESAPHTGTDVHGFWWKAYAGTCLCEKFNPLFPAGRRGPAVYKFFRPIKKPAASWRSVHAPLCRKGRRSAGRNRPRCRQVVKYYTSLWLDCPAKPVEMGKIHVSYPKNRRFSLVFYAAAPVSCPAALIFLYAKNRYPPCRIATTAQGRIALVIPSTRMLTMA